LGGASGLERLAAVEAALGALTSKAEELEFRINRVVTDGTNRLGDLEFRVCELEEGCDLGALGETPALGGVDSAAAVPQAQEPVAGPELAVGEQDAFERAEGVLADGDFQGAVDQLEAFVATYPGSPLSARAHVARGRAFEGLGDASGAARAFLDGFSPSPTARARPTRSSGSGATSGGSARRPTPA
jgi:TolA-binding protein